MQSNFDKPWQKCFKSRSKSVQMMGLVESWSFQTAQDDRRVMKTPTRKLEKIFYSENVEKFRKRQNLEEKNRSSI